SLRPPLLVLNSVTSQPIPHHAFSHSHDTPDPYTLSLHDALPIYTTGWQSWVHLENFSAWHDVPFASHENGFASTKTELKFNSPLDRKSTRLNSSHVKISYAVFCLKKKNSL